MKGSRETLRREWEALGERVPRTDRYSDSV